jgi:serine protease Do
MNYYPLNRGDDSSPDARTDDGRELRAEHGRSASFDADYISRSEWSAPPRGYGGPERPEKKRRRFSAAGIIALCLVCALLGTAVGLGFGPTNLFGAFGAEDSSSSQSALSGDSTQGSVGASSSPTLTAASVTGDAMAASDLYTMACSQVVGVTTEVTYTNAFGMTSSGAVTGSGFILTSDGYILTNYHVIEYAVQGNYKISVMLYDGTAYTATVVGYENDESDLAVLKIDATGLNPVTLGNSDDMRVGDTVYAVGNPLGELAYTMTRGMVSALDRDISSQDETTGETKTVNMFQFDAAVNSGNSGGPVYNEFGEVIGIVTAKYSSTGVEGLGFGIPINDATDIANDLIQNGYVSGKAYMGISVQTVSSAVAQYYNMVEGAYVYAVESGSCAEKAGLKMGDIITAMDSAEIKSSSDLVSAKKEHQAGDTVELTVYRDGQYLNLSLTFDENTNSSQQSSADDSGTQGGWSGSGFGSSGAIW